jgi:hypothetical protein
MGASWIRAHRRMSARSSAGAVHEPSPEAGDPNHRRRATGRRCDAWGLCARRAWAHGGRLTRSESGDSCVLPTRSNVPPPIGTNRRARFMSGASWPTGGPRGEAPRSAHRRFVAHHLMVRGTWLTSLVALVP